MKFPYVRTYELIHARMCVICNGIWTCCRMLLTTVAFISWSYTFRILAGKFLSQNSRTHVWLITSSNAAIKDITILQTTLVLLAHIRGTRQIKEQRNYWNICRLFSTTLKFAIGKSLVKWIPVTVRTKFCVCALRDGSRWQWQCMDHSVYALSQWEMELHCNSEWSLQ